MEKLMKKQTLKKRTKKIEKREGIANNKICENVIKNNNYGITLIALVITVIVLLILAGISISMLSGDNSILSRAGEAKIKTEKESAREQIGLEVLGSFNKYGDIDLNNLKTKLASLNADVSNIDDIMMDDAQTGKITLNGYDFYVDSNNNVLDYSGPVGTDTPEQSTKTAFSRANGRIDIVFLNGTGYSVTSTPNKPALDNTMVPVYYDTSVTPAVWKVCSDTDTTNWYDYHAADVSKAGSASDSENIQSKWANVMLTDSIAVQKDGTTYNTEAIKTKLTENKLSDLVGATVTTEGSMLVWIPRYAYRITYYSDASKTTIKGYSDSRGFVDTEGKTPSDMQTPTTSINVNGTIGTTNYEYYRPHPAFETDLDQGGWSKKITGIWVGKFEATGTTDAVTTIGTTNTVALKNKKIGELWTSLQNIKAGTIGSHMMKNSEWGAISYLAESKFGRNEVAITKNGNSSHYTGAGNYKANTNQSTTGNIYGVYDTVGGTIEYVASYIANSQNTNGYQFASIDGASTTNNNKTESTPYAIVYKHDTSDTNTNNYYLSLNKIFGDGICETSTEGTGQTSWHSACSNFVNSSIPFFLRGGADLTFTGSFDFNCNNGDANYGRGSRVVCVVK